jgi:hypothetical protein
VCPKEQTKEVRPVLCFLLYADLERDVCVY